LFVYHAFYALVMRNGKEGLILSDEVPLVVGGGGGGSGSGGGGG
jgi:hypothetical protein